MANLGIVALVAFLVVLLALVAREALRRHSLYPVERITNWITWGPERPLPLLSSSSVSSSPLGLEPADVE